MEKNPRFVLRKRGDRDIYTGERKNTLKGKYKRKKVGGGGKKNREKD